MKCTIEDMHEVAKSNGGICLSDRYISTHSKIKWQCKEGHQWKSTPASVKNQKCWCPICAGNQKNTIEEMNSIANERGGRCLSKEYINGNTKLKWQCEKGHQWDSVPDSVKRGSWCLTCSGNQKSTIEEMQKIATDRDGKCLSKKYKNAHSNLTWQCDKGHEWEAKPMHIKRGHWCHKCGARKGSQNQRSTIEEIQKLAVERGGKCLSEEYTGDRGKLLWECKEGHQWKTAPGNVKSGSWCHHCHVYYGEEIVRLYFEEIFNKKFPKSYPYFLKDADNSIRELDGYNKELRIAFEHHGVQHYKHSKHFHRGKQSLEITQQRDRERLQLCEENGVTLIIVPSVPDMLSINDLPDFLKSELHKKGINIDVPQGLNINAAYNKSAVEEFRELATSRGGVLVSQYYLGHSIKLTWQCAESHQWDATPNSIKHRESWCPECAGVQKSTIEEMYKVAEERGGKCLSEEYINGRTKLTWQCKEGHQWKATPSSVRNHGNWCPECAGVKKSTIEEMHELAEKRGGKCLSKQYKNTNSKIKWECEHGHQWQSVPASVKQGYWCPECAGMKKCTIEDMHKIAKERGGKCLSDKYINTHSKIKWQCKKGHQWESVPSSIKSMGRWCPECGGSQRGTIEEMQNIAKDRGGKCLSKEYINGRSRLLWQCGEGHQWKAQPRSLKHQGSWCPTCAKESNVKRKIN